VAAIAILSLLLCLTAPALAKAPAFFFVAIADTQLGFGNGVSEDAATFRNAVEHINRLKPAFVIILGDLINTKRDYKQTRAFWQVAGGIRKDVPLYLLPGNHDVGEPTSENISSYERLFGKDHYAFTFRGTEFIVLNSSLIQNPNASPDLTAAQRTWLEGTLAAAQSRRADHIFICTHFPWFITTPDEKDEYFNIPRLQRGEYLELMKRFGVDYALSGHLHRDVSATDGALHLITTTGLSRSFDSTPVGFRVFRVYKDRVEHTYYPLDKVPEHIQM